MPQANALAIIAGSLDREEAYSAMTSVDPQMRKYTTTPFGPESFAIEK